MSDLPGVLAEISQRLGAEVAQALGEHFAGCRLDIPCRRTQEIAARDAAIRRESNGRNLAELCERYGLSRWQLNRILKKK